MRNYLISENVKPVWFPNYTRYTGKTDLRENATGDVKAVTPTNI